MKRIIIAVLALSTLSVLFAEEINMADVKYALSTDRKIVFEKAMGHLITTPEAKNTFWDIYAKYDTEKGNLADKQMKVLADYAKNFQTLTDKQAKDLISDSSSNQKKIIDIRKKYSDMLTSKLGGVVGARFFEVDDMISTVARLGVLSNIPMIGEQAN